MQNLKQRCVGLSKNEGASPAVQNSRHLLILYPHCLGSFQAAGAAFQGHLATTGWRIAGGWVGGYVGGWLGASGRHFQILQPCL